MNSGSAMFAITLTKLYTHHVHQSCQVKVRLYWYSEAYWLASSSASPYLGGCLHAGKVPGQS